MSFTLFVFLQEFEGSVVVTSHDRRLLREVCQVPWLQRIDLWLMSTRLVANDDGF